MRQYDLYRIDKSVALYYYGRERKFFGLFKEYRDAEGEFRQIVDGQVNFITKNIPILPLHQLLKESSKRMQFLFNEGNLYWIKKDQQSEEYAYMELSEKKITIHATGDHELENVFFEILKKMDNFLAIDLENERYGWLKPWRERKYI